MSSNYGGGYNTSYPSRKNYTSNSTGIQKFSRTGGVANRGIEPTGGRDQKVDPDLYYRVKDENEQLKKTTLTLNDKIKKLEANLKTKSLRRKAYANSIAPHIQRDTELTVEKIIRIQRWWRMLSKVIKIQRFVRGFLFRKC